MIRISYALLLLLAPAALAAQAHLRAVRSYTPSHEAAIVAELRELLAIPNVAADSVNIRRNAQALVVML